MTGTTTTRPQGWCEGCVKWLPATEFDPDTRRSCGMKKRCRPCAAEQAKAKNHAAQQRYRARQEITANLTPCPSGRAKCFNARCQQEGRFVLVDGRRACVRCLKAIVKERKTDAAH